MRHIPRIEHNSDITAETLAPAMDNLRKLSNLSGVGCTVTELPGGIAIAVPPMPPPGFWAKLGSKGQNVADPTDTNDPTIDNSYQYEWIEQELTAAGFWQDMKNGRSSYTVTGNENPSLNVPVGTIINPAIEASFDKSLPPGTVIWLREARYGHSPDLTDLPEPSTSVTDYAPASIEYVFVKGTLRPFVLVENLVSARLQTTLPGATYAYHPQFDVGARILLSLDGSTGSQNVNGNSPAGDTGSEFASLPGQYDATAFLRTPPYFALADPPKLDAIGRIKAVYAAGPNQTDGNIPPLVYGYALGNCCTGFAQYHPWTRYDHPREQASDWWSEGVDENGRAQGWWEIVSLNAMTTIEATVLDSIPDTDTPDSTWWACQINQDVVLAKRPPEVPQLFPDDVVTLVYNPANLSLPWNQRPMFGGLGPDDNADYWLIMSNSVPTLRKAKAQSDWDHANYNVSAKLLDVNGNEQGNAILIPLDEYGGKIDPSIWSGDIFNVAWINGAWVSLAPPDAKIGSVDIWTLPGAIPKGWCLCDGANGSPDLRDLFVLASGPIHPFGTQAGGNNHHHILDTANGLIGNVTLGGVTPLPGQTSGIVVDGGHPAGEIVLMPPYYTLAYIYRYK